ncbi:ubiquitin-associated protein 1-like [Heteronotia binoei]|uniref:ubiquitin-associated protein 1-like n=1 Tax=Heteronotia binoei TaxID=13085 RepID=UPI002931A8AE|nr:ubiquitin-associated protein 1-like [Heteronotia binoei]
MSCLEDVPFRMSSSFVEDSEREANFVRAPEFDMPDYEEILLWTMHDFLLEKRVLYWAESGSWQDIPWCQVTTDVIPTAPPSWLLFADSEENSHEETGESSMAEAPPVYESSVSPDGSDEAQPIASGNGDQHAAKGEDPKGEGSSSANSTESKRENPPEPKPVPRPGAFARFFGLPQPKPRTSPVPPPTVTLESNCPKPSLIKQRQSLLLLNNVKNEWERAKGKLAAFLHPLTHSSTESSLASRSVPLSQRNRNNRNLRNRSASDASAMGTLMPTPSSTTSGALQPPTSAGSVAPIQKHKPTVAVRNESSLVFVFLLLFIMGLIQSPPIFLWPMETSHQVWEQNNWTRVQFHLRDPQEFRDMSFRGSLTLAEVHWARNLLGLTGIVSYWYSYPRLSRVL